MTEHACIHAKLVHVTGIYKKQNTIFKKQKKKKKKKDKAEVSPLLPFQSISRIDCGGN